MRCSCEGMGGLVVAGTSLDVLIVSLTIQQRPLARWPLLLPRPRVLFLQFVSKPSRIPMHGMLLVPKAVASLGWLGDGYTDWARGKRTACTVNIALRREHKRGRPPSHRFGPSMDYGVEIVTAAHISTVLASLSACFSGVAISRYHEDDGAPSRSCGRPTGILREVLLPERRRIQEERPL